MQKAGEQCRVRIDARAPTRNHVAQARDQHIPLPQRFELLRDRRELRGGTQLPHGECDRGGSYGVQSNARNGGTQIRYLAAGWIQRHGIGHVEKLGGEHRFRTDDADDLVGAYVLICQQVLHTCGDIWKSCKLYLAARQLAREGLHERERRVTSDGKQRCFGEDFHRCTMPSVTQRPSAA